MDKRPIGVFDSGLGGLTGVRELNRILPGEDIIFFGDTGRVPYGSRSPEVIREYASECMRFLESQNVKLILVACGTVSSVFGKELGNGYSVPCMGVLMPTVDAALAATKNNKIGLIATEATVKSRSYESIAKEKRPETEFFGKACPLFVPLVENGYFSSNSEVVRLVAKDYLSAFDGKDIDTLILGCTHYPLLYNLIDKLTGYKLNLIDAGREAAAAVRDCLAANDMLSEKTEGGTNRYFVTDDPDGFARLGSSFLGRKFEDVVKIDIEKLKQEKAK